MRYTGVHIKKSSVIGLLGLMLALCGVAYADTTATLLPGSDGTYSSWTPKSGSTHYTMVDESTCNGTTDYVSTNTSGNRDSFGISITSIPNGSTITGIAITPCASRNANGNGSATMNVFYRYNGVNSADQGGYALTGTTPTSLSATTFSGLSITKGSSDTLEVGAVYTSGTKGARLSRIATVVTYTLPPTPPTVTTLNPDFLIGSSTALTILRGEANPNGNSTTGWFRYDTSDPGTCSDTFGTRAPEVGGTTLDSGTSTVPYEQYLFLSPGLTYYYCALASSVGGTSVGAIQSFIAP